MKPASFDFFMVRDFVSVLEARQLMHLIDDHARYLPDPYGGQPHCKCARIGFNQLNEPIAAELEKRFADELGFDPELCRDLQGQLYMKGEYYGAHWDAFHENAPHYAAEMARGGQRTWTAMLYLNEVRDGGHTYFPNAQITIRPKPGRAVFWNNLDENRQPHYLAQHASEVVREGRKYIVTAWFREGA